MPTTGFLIASGAAIAFALVFPVVAGFVAHRRLGVSWRYFGYGALVFFLSQVVTRIPAVQIAQVAIAPQLQSSPALVWGWLVMLAVTAGLFEEVGRYLGYRFLMRREEKTWAKAVMFGIGHAGLEAMLLSGVLAAVTIANIVFLGANGLDSVPADQRDLAARQLQAIAEQPGWLPLMGAWERLWTMPVHVGLSVMVLQVFTRGSIRWLWLAIAAHAVVDLLAVGLLQGLGSSTTTTLVVEMAVAVCGATGLWIIWRLRPPPPSPD